MMCSIIWLFVGALGVVESSALDIPSQLQQRLTLLNTTNKVLAKEYLEEKFPFLKSECVTDALKSFLPICLNKGMESVDSAIRVEAAVKLSICEFKASGLEYIPNSCESWDVDSMMDCMIRLESSAQWWTTYSGNYQRLPTVCFESSLPYEKQQILDLFLNVTTMYNDISDTLQAQFYELIANSESALKRHTENMADMFQEYMNDFSQKANAHEEDIEKEFMAQKTQVRDLITRNSASLGNELAKKDAQFMTSFDHVLDIVHKIAVELSDMDIAHEINLRNRAALEKWAEVDHIAQKVGCTLNENNIQMGKQWENFLTSAKEDMSAISSDLVNNQNRALEMLNEYDDILRDTVIPSITDDMLPQMQALQQQILSEWREIAGVINQDVIKWNDEVTHNFEMISRSLNTTLEKVNDLEDKVSKLHSMFNLVRKVFELILKTAQYNYMILYHLFTNKLFWAFVVLTINLPKLARISFTKTIFVLVFDFLRLVLKWCLIFIMIFIGSKFGTLMVSNNP